MRIGVIGGDTRMAMMAEQLAEQGERVFCFGLERYSFRAPCLICDRPAPVIESAGMVVLPLPVTRDGETVFAPLSEQKIMLDEVIASLSPGQLTVGGAIGERTASRFHAAGIRPVDYFAREEVAVKNAVATVEGAIEIAMRETDRTVSGSRVLILGYGRIGKVAAERFAALGASVSVAARKAGDLAWIAVRGAVPVPFARYADGAARYDLVLNTVPAPVMGEAELALLREDAVVLDLASDPGGVDFAAAKRLGRRALPCWSLPGKVAPRSAAAILSDAVLALAEEYHVE